MHTNHLPAAGVITRLNRFALSRSWIAPLSAVANNFFGALNLVGYNATNVNLSEVSAADANMDVPEVCRATLQFARSVGTSDSVQRTPSEENRSTGVGTF